MDLLGDIGAVDQLASSKLKRPITILPGTEKAR